MPRQTNFNLEELIGLLGGLSNYPQCLLINEIGAICCNGEDKDFAGEKSLLAQLGDNSLKNRATAFYFLSRSPEMAERNKTELEQFRLNPENEAVLSQVDEALQKV